MPPADAAAGRVSTRKALGITSSFSPAPRTRGFFVGDGSHLFHTHSSDLAMPPAGSIQRSSLTTPSSSPDHWPAIQDRAASGSDAGAGGAVRASARTAEAKKTAFGISVSFEPAT